MTNPDDPYIQSPVEPVAEPPLPPPYQGQYQQYQQTGYQYDAYQQPVYPQQGFPQHGYGGYPQQPAGTNGLAIASLICSILGAFCGIGFLVGIVLGVLALTQIKTTGQQGRGMAIAGIVIGGVSIALLLIAVIFLFAVGSFSMYV